MGSLAVRLAGRTPGGAAASSGSTSLSGDTAGLCDFLKVTVERKAAALRLGLTLRVRVSLRLSKELEVRLGTPPAWQAVAATALTLLGPGLPLFGA